MSMRKIFAIIEKQLKDTWKNKEVLIQFIMFPVMALIMENAISIPGMPEHYFVKLFSSMYIGMAPLVSMASIVAEEKEKNTLRVLLMSDVKAGEYLVGVGSYVFAACVIGSGILAAAGSFHGKELAAFLGIMCVGILVSLLLGATVGIFSRTQMAATSITVPLMMVFSFLPMIGSFNEKVKQVALLTFSGQIYEWMQKLGSEMTEGKGIVVVCCNMLMAGGFFLVAYQRSLKR